MKTKIFFSNLALAIAVLLSSCGGGDPPSNSTGTVSMNVTDARPVLPSGTAKILATFDEVSVHSAGGGWTTLPLPQTPFTIDLLQFADGNKTQLVPPVQLTSGKYTQIRLGVTSATLIFLNGQSQDLEIPSENLKTVQEFDFTVMGSGAVDLTVDFDLSQSIVVTGLGTYQLKPVLHILQTQEAATINGKMSESAFGGRSEAIVVVTLDRDNSEDITAADEEYTKITVAKSSGVTQFSIFWLVPNNGYIVQIKIGDVVIYTQALTPSQMSAGAVASLNGGNAI